jgi:peptidoglycan/xylan/chitin deacetylase (PgdA/CDA1 family)
MASGMAFLMYHELEVPGRPLCQSDTGYKRYVVARGMFDDHIRYLKDLGYTGLSVSGAVQSQSTRSLVVTFDDGAESDLLYAAPCLAAAGFQATFYVTVGFLGTPGFLSVSQLKELSAAGFEIGCHSMTHAYLPDLDAAAKICEIAYAKQQLEQLLGLSIEHYSCPGGRFDEDVVQAVKRAGYKTMATSRPRVNASTTDRYHLSRIPVLRGTHAKQVATICAGEGLIRMDLQERFRATAKRVLGNRLYDRIREKLLPDEA